jgi:hypothetical protein
MTATVIQFPRPARADAIRIRHRAGEWLVLTPKGHAWLHATLGAARADAQWLARNFGLPIREVVS